MNADTFEALESDFFVQRVFLRNKTGKNAKDSTSSTARQLNTLQSLTAENIRVAILALIAALNSVVVIIVQS